MPLIKHRPLQALSLLYDKHQPMSLFTKTGMIYCLLLLALPGRAQEYAYLHGTIGAYPIAMRISCYNDTDCGDTRYYYKKMLKDIVLEGNRNGKHYILRTSEYGTEPRETFDLNEQADHSFTGTWSAGNKKLPVKLQPLRKTDVRTVPAFVKNSDNEGLSDPYEYLRASNLLLVRDSVIRYKNKEFVWFREKASDMSLFRLGNGFSPEQLKKINPLLDEIQLTEAMNQMSCSGFSGGSIDFTVNISYLDEHLLGFRIFSSWFCGGAHPDFGGQGYLLELNTGKQFDLDDILAFDTSAVSEARGGFDRFSDYRNNFFAPKMLELMTQAQGFEKPKEEEEDQCDYTDTEIWDYPSWEFGEEGISFTPIFGRAMRACEEAFLLTFEQLKAYKNPKFRYSFPTVKKQ